MGDRANVAMPQKDSEGAFTVHLVFIIKKSIYVTLFNMEWWEGADVVHPSILFMLVLLLNANA